MSRPLMLLLLNDSAPSNAHLSRMTLFEHALLNIMKFFDSRAFIAGERTRKGCLEIKKCYANPDILKKMTSRKIIASLAKSVLHDWDIVALTDREIDSLELALGNNGRGDRDDVNDLLAILGITEHGEERLPDAVIADVWFPSKLDDDDGTENRAREFLEHFAGLPGGCYTHLLSTLPEGAAPSLPDELNASETPTNFGAFTPLFHDHTSAWDELTNLFLYVRSQHTFGKLIGALQKKKTPSDAVIKAAARKYGIDVLKADEHGKITGVVCQKPVLVLCQGHNTNLVIEGCVFEKEVLLYRCNFGRTVRIQRCIFHGILAVDRCSFEEDLIVEFNTFTSALPWFHGNDFQGRFMFRANRLPSRATPAPWRTQVRSPATPPEALEATPANDENSVVPQLSSLNFHRCRFSERAFIDVGIGRTKLALYHCRFADGNYTEISCSYGGNADFSLTADVYKDKPESPYFRFRPLFDPNHPTDDPIDRHDGDVRIINCSIGGRLVIREHPWPTGPFDHYYGAGLNLRGSTVHGAIDIRRVRLRWLNIDRTAFTGGEVFMTPHGLMTSYQKPGLFDWVSLAADRPGIIFEERLMEGREFIRFSTHVVRRSRLYELNSSLEIEAARCQSIAQQYEDLRNAFARSPNTDWEEDFCHFKSLKFREAAQNAQRTVQHLHRYRNRHIRNVEQKRLMTGLRVMPEMIIMWICLHARIILAHVGGSLQLMKSEEVSEQVRSIRTKGFYAGAGERSKDYTQISLWQLANEQRVISMCYAFLYLIAYFATCACLLAWFGVGFRDVTHHEISILTQVAAVFLAGLCLASGRVQLMLGQVASRIMLHVFGGGIYISRTVLVGAMSVLGFAALYYFAGALGPQPAGIGSGKAEEQDLVACIYFSIVTFTTLGYGDLQPIGWVRLAAAAEAGTGAVTIAWFTVSLVRRYLRR